MSTGVVCGYSVSGGYGLISRFLYYSLLIITLIFHKTEWLVSSSLGASMIFSSIAAIHAVALASARGRGTVDFDIIPVYSITGVGLLIGTPLLVWSKTLREAKSSTRFLAFAWIGLMFVGAMASRASMVKLPTPFDCSDPMALECPLTCNVSLPMRQGQPTQIIAFHWSDFLDTWSLVYSWMACSFTAMGLMFAHGRQHPMDLARDQLRARGISRRLRRKNANRTANCAVCSPPLSAGLSVAHIILMEVILIGPSGIPLGENQTAIGQWGPLVGAAFALVASIIQWKFGTEGDTNIGEDVEMAVNSVLTPGQRAPAPTASLTRSTPSSSAVTHEKVAKPHDVSNYFVEGRWWGTVANGMIMNHGGVNWVVRDGYLRRFVSSGNDAEIGEPTTQRSGTLINTEETSAKPGTTFSVQTVGVISKDAKGLSGVTDGETKEQQAHNENEIQARSSEETPV